MFIDPFGRAITHLRISLTDRCNLRCVYCMPKEGLQWQPRADQLSVEEIVRVVETASQGGVKRVRLTGGEPLVHPQVVEIVRRIASIPNIEEVSLTTNAMLLERLAWPLADVGLTRVNISLDSLDANMKDRSPRGACRNGSVCCRRICPLARRSVCWDGWRMKRIVRFLKR